MQLLVECFSDTKYWFGFYVGMCAFYITLYRPIVKLKDEYIKRLQERLDERYK